MSTDEENPARRSQKTEYRRIRNRRSHHSCPRARIRNGREFPHIDCFQQGPRLVSVFDAGEADVDLPFRDDVIGAASARIR
jgi:hypothetical protein